MTRRSLYVEDSLGCARGGTRIASAQCFQGPHPNTYLYIRAITSFFRNIVRGSIQSSVILFFPCDVIPQHLSEGELDGRKSIKSIRFTKIIACDWAVQAELSEIDRVFQHPSRVECTSTCIVAQLWHWRHHDSRWLHGLMSISTWNETHVSNICHNAKVA